MNFCLPLSSLLQQQQQEEQDGDKDSDDSNDERRQRRVVEEEELLDTEQFESHAYGNALRYTNDEQQDTLRKS